MSGAATDAPRCAVAKLRLEISDMVKSNRASRGGSKNKGKAMRADTTAGPGENHAARVDPRVQSEIGKHLRAMYDDVIKEPVPTKFIELLEKLERSTSKG
jgi:hypothetical protein